MRGRNDKFHALKLLRIFSSSFLFMVIRDFVVELYFIGPNFNNNFEIRGAKMGEITLP